MLWLFVRPGGFAYWVSFAPVFGFVYWWVLVFALSPCYILLYLGLCVPGDVVLMGWGSFMQARYLCVYVSIRIGGGVGTRGLVWAL